MEWAILEAFDAPDATTVTAADLAGVPPERWSAIQFALTPSLQLLALRWPVHTLWERVQHGEPVCELEPGATTLRVWRQDLRVFHRVIDAAERAALQAIQGGATFAAVCERIADHVPEADGAEVAAAFVATWLADGVLSSLRVTV